LAKDTSSYLEMFVVNTEKYRLAQTRRPCIYTISPGYVVLCKFMPCDGRIRLSRGPINGLFTALEQTLKSDEKIRHLFTVTMGSCYGSANYMANFDHGDSGTIPPISILIGRHLYRVYGTTSAHSVTFPVFIWGFTFELKRGWTHSKMVTL